MRAAHLILLLTAIAALCLPGAARAQEGEAGKVRNRRRFIYVPYEDMDKALGKGKHGVIVEFEEYLRLLREARLKKQARPPVQWVIHSSRYTGIVGEEQVKFTGELTFSVLRKGFSRIALPFGAVGITSAQLDGKPANIILAEGGYALLLRGESGARTLSLSFAAKLTREKRGKSLGLRIPPAPCTTVTLRIPAKAEVSISPDIFSKTYSEKDDATTVEIFAGGKDFILAHIAAEEKKEELEPFVTTAPELLVSLDRETIRVKSHIAVKVYRRKISSLSVSLPGEYKVVDLDCRDILDWTHEEEAGAGKVTLNFRRPIEDTVIELALEKDMPADMVVEVPLVQVPGALAGRPLIQIAPARDVSFEISRAENLNEITPRASSASNAAKPVKAFVGWPGSYSLTLKVTPVAPSISSFLTTLVTVERAKLGLNFLCTFEVKEGFLYNASLAVPKEWEILSVATGLEQDQYDYAIVPANGGNTIEVYLRRRLGPGDVLQVSVSARMLPSGADWEELRIPVPRIVPSGSKLRLGTIVFRGEDSMTLSGRDVAGLSDLDVTQVEHRGISVRKATLGYEVKKDDYSGTVIVRRKKPRLSATCVTYLAVNESLFSAVSLLSLRFGERPAREFGFVLPPGTGDMVDIRGNLIKEKSLTTRPDGDHWKISLQKEVLGQYHLYVAYELKVGQDMAELAAPKILVPDAERQDGFIGVEAGEGIEILARAQNLREVPVTSMPSPLHLTQYYQPRRVLIHAFRYIRTDYSLSLNVTRHALKPVLTMIVPSVSYATVFSKDGVERTRALFELTSVGNQFFTFRLPRDAQLWSVLLGRDASGLSPVKPAKNGQQIMVPLTAAQPHAKGRENTYFIAVIYQRKSDVMTGSGTIEMSLPEIDEGIPVLQSQWLTYLPREYRYTSFGGDMKLATRRLTQPLFLEYMWVWIAGIAALLVGVACAGYLRYLFRRRVALYVTAGATGVILIALLLIAMMSGAGSRSAYGPPAIVTSREFVQVDKDIPRGTSFDNLSNKNLDSTSSIDKKPGMLPEEEAEIPADTHLGRYFDDKSKEKKDESRPRRPAPRPGPITGALELPPSEPEPTPMTELADDIRARKERERGLLSLAVDLRFDGTPLSFFSLSPGGTVTVDYVSGTRVLVECLIITLLVFAVAVRIRKEELRIKLIYVLAGAVVLSLLPGAAGPSATIYCNAAIFGVAAGGLFFCLGALAKYYRQLVAAAVLLLTACCIFIAPDAAFAGGGGPGQKKGQAPPARPVRQVEKPAPVPPPTPTVDVKEPEPEAVIVPYNPEDLKGGIPGKKRVHIGSKRYEDLLRAAGLLPPQAEESPRLFSVNSGCYGATILSDRIDFEVEMHLDLLRAEAAEIFIGFPGIALKDTKLNGKKARLHAKAEGYFLILTEKGSYTFSAKFSLPIDAGKVTGSVEFPVRPIPCALLKARTTRPGTDIIVKSAIGGQEASGPEGAREVSAALGPASSISMSYGPEKTVATGASRATDARLTHYHWLSEGLVLYRCDARVKVSGGERDAFSFALPDGLEIHQVVTPKELRAWRIARDERGGRTLEVLLYEPVKEELSLTVNGAQVLPKKTGELKLPFLRALMARKETGTACVFLSNTLKCHVTGSRNLIQTPSSAKTRDNFELHSAYEYSSCPVELGLATTEKKPDLRADIFTQLAVAKEKLHFKTFAQITVAQAPVFNLSLEVPGGFDIEEITCPHMVSKLVKSAGAKKLITVQLSRPLLGKTTITVVGSTLAPEGAAELDIPQVALSGVKFVQGHIVVSSDEGIALTTKKRTHLIPIDVRTVPYPRNAALPQGTKRLAFAFRKEGYSGAVGVERLKPVLSANSVSSALVRDEMVSFTTVIEYGISSAPCRRFSFSMPQHLAGKAVLTIPFERQRTQKTEGEGEDARVVWTIELQRELADSYHIAVNWDEIVRDGKSFAVPAITPVDVQSSRAYVMLQNSSGLKVSEGEKKNLEPAGKEEIPLLNAVQVQRAIFLGSYRARNPREDFGLSFSLEKLKEEKEIEAIIDIAEITTVVSREGYSFNEASYRIQNKARQYLQVRMPPGAQLWSAQVAGRLTKPALPPGGDGGGIILLPLLKRGKGQMSYSVKIFYGLKLSSKPGFGSSFPLKSPVPLDINVGQTFWTVYAPDEFEYGFDGNMEEVIEATREVDKVTSYAQEAQRLVQELDEAADREQKEQIAGNIEQFNRLMQEQIKRAEVYQGRFASQTEEMAGKFRQQYEKNISKLDMAQKQLAGQIRRIQDEKSKLARQAAKKRPQADAGFVAPQAEQAQQAGEFLQKTQKRVREQIASEEKARRDISAVDRLSNKNLDSTSCVDAYGIGGGRAGGYGQRWGKGSLAREGGSPGTESAVSASLRWLHFHQDRDGKWDNDGFDKNCDRRKGVICDGRGSGQYDVAVTSLALLAFLGNGHTHRVGLFKKTVKRGFDWLLNQQQPDGSFGARRIESWIYNHAIAACAVCEAYACTRDYRFKAPAQRAIDFIRVAQNPGLGWKYEPQDGRNDTSVTGWMVMALKAAKTAGLNVEQSMFDGAVNWFDRATNAAGKTGYMRPGDDGSVIRGVNERYAKLPTMTAAAIISRIFCGQSRRDPKILKGVDILMANLPEWNKPYNTKVDFYYWYYGTYAMFQFGGQKWHKWNTAMKRALLDSERIGGCADGSWDPAGKWGRIGGRVYATALNSLTLEIYYRYSRAHPGKHMTRTGWADGLDADKAAVEHGARAAGFMPPRIQLPKVGRTLSFKKLGTDPVLVLHSSDSRAYEKIHASVKLLSLLLLLAAAFVLKLSFFGRKSLHLQVGDGAFLAFVALLSVLTVWVAIPVACICVLLLVFRNNRRLALIRS